ncbi:hypothetical protein KIN20_032305 [Parelaphostrongylus tenuis]|uniref:CHHC U11-48K-type domain-containing protein n=1 Tax=Parelaphostrongylus tenuis TaxID=148309 RepID=A0AAD5R6S7_PARTN|nr:hypothetical protein KIN20_032305 [Parelaphostrongylus tenuis]
MECMMSYNDRSGRSSHNNHRSMNSTGHSFDDQQLRDDYRQQRRNHENRFDRDEDRRPSRDGDLRNGRPLPSAHQTANGDDRNRERPSRGRRLAESRRFTKYGATVESIREGRGTIVMCQFNPMHMVDEVDIAFHEEHCEDRSLLEQYGGSFDNKGSSC